MDEDAKEGRDPAPAVTRSIRLLGLLADARGPRTLTELAGSLGLAKSSTANLCLALEAAGMIDRTAQGYRLGLRTAELGGAFAAQFNQVREFYTVCDSSEVLHAELVQVAMLDGSDALYLARHEGSSSLRIGTPLGSRLPAPLSATGRALLSRMADDEVIALLGADAVFPALTERSTTTMAGLLEVLAADLRLEALEDGLGELLAEGPRPAGDQNGFIVQHGLLFCPSKWSSRQPLIMRPGSRVLPGEQNR